MSEGDLHINLRIEAGQLARGLDHTLAAAAVEVEGAVRGAYDDGLVDLGRVDVLLGEKTRLSHVHGTLGFRYQKLGPKTSE